MVTLFFALVVVIVLVCVVAFLSFGIERKPKVKVEAQSTQSSKPLYAGASNLQPGAFRRTKNW